MNRHLRIGVATALGALFAATTLPLAVSAAPNGIAPAAMDSGGPAITQVRYRKTAHARHAIGHRHAMWRARHHAWRHRHWRYGYRANPGAAIFGSVLGLMASGAFNDYDYPAYGYGPYYGYAYPSYGYAYPAPVYGGWGYGGYIPRQSFGGFRGHLR